MYKLISVLEVLFLFFMFFTFCFLIEGRACSNILVICLPKPPPRIITQKSNSANINLGNLTSNAKWKL